MNEKTSFEMTSKQFKFDTDSVVDAVKNIILTGGCGYSVKIKRGFFQDTVTFTIRGTIENCAKVKQMLGFGG